MYNVIYAFIMQKNRQGCQNCILLVQTKFLWFSDLFSKRERKWPTSFKNVNAIGKHRVKKRSL